MKSSSLNQKIEGIFAEIGEFGPYQLLVFILVGITAFIPAIVGYSYSFYAAVPNFRCKIPNLANDTYEVWSDYHKEQIERYVPLSKDTAASYTDIYDKCHIKVYENSLANFTLAKCDQYVYSKEYFKGTLMTDWNLLCDKSSKKSFFSTLYFIGSINLDLICQIIKLNH
jgi:OCT family organic cation transporter-like MFS transporter 4/5